MLAVVSMALVSCGGDGGGGGLKPAKNAFLYAEYGDCCGEEGTEVIPDGKWDDELHRFRDLTKYYRMVDDKGSNDCLKDCLKITQVAIAKTGMRHLAVTVDLEVLKDIVLPKCEIDDFEPRATFELLDKNSVVLKQIYVKLPVGKKGDVKSLSIDIETGDYNGKDSPDAILKNAKYVRFNNVHVDAGRSRKLIKEEVN